MGVPATGVLVETLLDRRADVDVAEARPRSHDIAAAPTDDGVAVRDVWLLRLRALLARAHGDETAYRDYRDRYRAMATSLGFEGHIAWAEGDAMTVASQKAACLDKDHIRDTADLHGVGHFSTGRAVSKISRRNGLSHSRCSIRSETTCYRNSAAAVTATGSRSLVSEATSKSSRCFIRGSQNRLM